MSSEVAISNHPRRTALAAVLRTLALSAADERRTRLGDGLDELLKEQGLDALEGQAGELDVVGLLRRFETDRPALVAHERAALRRLLAHGVADHVVADALAADVARVDELAARLTWLAATTVLDALSELDGVLGASDVDPLWRGIGRRVRALDAEGTGDARAEAIVALAALARSASPAAIEALSTLVGELLDPGLRDLAERLAPALDDGDALGSDQDDEPTSEPSEEDDSAAPGEGEVPVRAPTRRSLHARRAQVVGQGAPRPLGGIGMVLAGVTGWLALRFLARLGANVLLRCERRSEVRVDGSGIYVTLSFALLGRTLRTRELSIPFANLASAAREVAYPRLGLYAGLGALSLGTYLGVSLASDGVWSRSPSLVALGAGVFGVGLALDFLLSGIGVGRGGAHSLVFVPRRGAPIAVAVDDVHAADEVLRAIADRSL
ncbi:MAG: hypothetical protein FJ095_01045 [Deltaproteobacteria bacterium]|nr:hypothetical protein [Deltaproteobacteria bacterium]